MNICTYSCWPPYIHIYLVLFLLVTFLLADDKPLVECSFVTEFEDHIFVTVDAEAFFFLHDLITSYLREKDKMVIISLTRLLLACKYSIK